MRQRQGFQRRKMKKVRSALNVEIARQMGTLNKQPLWQVSNPRLQAMFHPHSERGIEAGYPLSHIHHEFAKLPITSIANFVNVPEVMAEIRRAPAVSALLTKYPQLERSFEQSVWEAIRERGIKGSKFWTKAPKEYIDWIVAAGKQRPNAMNEKVGKVIASVFGKEVKPRTILDIGTFAGGTIKGAISQLSPAQRAQLTLVLVDVNEQVVRQHAVPELEKMGVPRKNIHVIPTSFYAAAVAFRLMPKPLHERGLRGYEKEFLALLEKVDAVVAGAATLNFANDLNPLLGSSRRLLKPGGVFVDWEWGSKESRTPTVNIPQLRKAVVTYKISRDESGRTIKTPVTEFDAYVSFLNFWMGSFRYPENVKEKLFADIEASREFNFFAWCEQHAAWMENERAKTGEKPLPAPAGFRNRAYRDGNEMTSAIRENGFRTGKPIYWFAQPGKRDTGNVNWMVVARKR
jgi:SAM-dependent methyltransferase